MRAVARRTSPCLSETCIRCEQFELDVLAEFNNFSNSLLLLRHRGMTSLNIPIDPGKRAYVYIQVHKYATMSCSCVLTLPYFAWILWSADNFPLPFPYSLLVIIVVPYRRFCLCECDAPLLSFLTQITSLRVSRRLTSEAMLQSLLHVQDSARLIAAARLHLLRKSKRDGATALPMQNSLRDYVLENLIR